jgi:polyferredoxin
MVERGQIENVYRLNLMNASEQPMAVSIGVTGVENIALASEPNYTIGSTEVRAVAIRVRVPPMSLKPGSHEIQFVVNIAGSSTRIEEASTFIVPR